MSDPLLLLPPLAAAAACLGIAAFMVALQAAVKPSCGQGVPAQKLHTWLNHLPQFIRM
jgi:uncharacterized membrane protein